MTWLTRFTGCLLVTVLTIDVGLVAGGRDDTDPGVELRRRNLSVDQLAQDFLDRYVADDGRVVRHDQGGDTVSEGQAYAMLLAVALDDRVAFDRAWGWTRAHLQRDDGLLAWHWVDGEVVDRESAADADLDAAWALALADRRWPGAGFGAQAKALAGAVDAIETAPLPDGRLVLVPGPWARAHAESAGRTIVDPSYSSPLGEAVLVRAGHLPPARSHERLTTMRSLIATLVGRNGVPPDWAAVGGDGVRSVASPDDHGPGAYGWDAVRVPLRLAASCYAADRALAAQLAPALREGAGRDEMGDHPARLVGAASALMAAGEREEAGRLLARASQAQEEHPTYYGGALVALAGLLLTTDRLGACPPT